ADPRSFDLPRAACSWPAGVDPGLRRDDGVFKATRISENNVMPAKAGTHASFRTCNGWTTSAPSAAAAVGQAGGGRLGEDVIRQGAVPGEAFLVGFLAQ